MRSRTMFVTAIVIIMVLASCSPAATETPTSATSSIPEISPDAERVISYDDRLVAELEILKEPDELLFVNGAVWTKTADGHLIEIDSQATEIVADVKVDTTSDPYHYCQGLGTDGTEIWACSASGDADHRRTDVVRFDPRSKSVVATFDVNKVFDQRVLPVLNDQIWVLSDLGTELIGISVHTDEISDPIELGFRCFELGVVRQSLMATCAQNDLVLLIDVVEGKVMSEVSLTKPRYVRANQYQVWISLDNSIVQLDPVTLVPTATITDLPRVGSTGDVLVTDDAIWVRQDDAFLYRIDAETLKVTEQITPSKSLSGGGVLIAADSIWVTAYDDNLLARLTLKP